MADWGPQWFHERTWTDLCTLSRGQHGSLQKSFPHRSRVLRITESRRSQRSLWVALAGARGDAFIDTDRVEIW